MDKDMRAAGLLLNSTPPIEAGTILGIDEAWVKALWTRIMTYVAQEKEGLQNAEEVSAAIQEAIKGITCLSNETVTETIDFGSHKPTNTTKPETAEKVLSPVEFGNIKRLDLTLKITLAKGTNPYTGIVGNLYLPSGGRYIKYNVSETDELLFESFSIVEGGSFIGSVTNLAERYLNEDKLEINDISVYLARFD